MAQLLQDVTLEDFQKWVLESGRNGVNIVVVGETGAGKSTLVNGLIGKDAVKKAATYRSASGVTHCVQEYPVTGHAEVKVFDTPGLCDPKLKKSDVFQEIAEKTRKKIDLLLFCHDMRAKVKQSDVDIISCIAAVFQAEGNSWDNVLYILTFANKVENDLREEEQDTPSGQGVQVNIVQKFAASLKDYQNNLKEHTEDVIRREGRLPNPETIANNIPVVPAGYRKASLPDRKDWLTSLWKAALTRVRDTAVPAFIEATALSRLQPEGAGPDTSQNLPAQRQLDDEELRSCQFKSKIGIPAGLVFGTVLFGLITLAGAGFGSLAGPGGTVIGAKAGAILGAKIGGTVGTSVGGIGGLVYAAYMQSRADSLKKNQ